MFYKNIAEIYAYARPPYPAALFELIISKLPAHARNLYIDIGCGTGELLFPFGKYFKKSYGIDSDQDMLKAALLKMEAEPSQEIHLIKRTAEIYLNQLPRDLKIDLVTAGRSLHWMKQEIVIQEIFSRLRPGGILAVLGEAGGGIWRKNVPWMQEVRRIVFEAFPYKDRFIPIRGHQTTVSTIQKNINLYPFHLIEELTVESKQQWDLQMIINLYYSASGFLEWLGDEKEVFENYVKEALLKISPEGKFEDGGKFGITCCIK